MKINRAISIIAITLLVYYSIAEGFAGKTHKVISEKAIINSQTDGYLKNKLGFSQGLGTSLLLDQAMIPAGERIPTAQFETRITPELPSNPCSILNFLKAGANLEDIPNPRARHHFHSPIANTGVNPPNPNSGLDNKTDHPKLATTFNTLTLIKFPGYSFNLTGASNLERALGIEDTQWEQEYENYFAWPDTRVYFYRALTKANIAERNHYLALMFLSLGHTAHLLEDMGVPAHTRNDFVYGHMRLSGSNVFTDWGNPFEYWAENQIIASNNNMPSSWLTGWTPQPEVFDKISKYWDTDTYEGTYIGQPSSSWGLAEQTNYQFLSTSTTFDCKGTKYKFPNPSKTHLGSDLQVSVPLGTKLYFNGSSYGVPHIARKSYTYYYADITGVVSEAIDSTITPDDVNVYEDYAAVTIPRTIDYTTGLLNYFFRGRLSIEPNWTDPNIAEFVITNDSNNSGIPQTLKGGTFEIYWDDINDTRTKIDPNSIIFTPEWTPAATLPNDGGTTSLTAQFTMPIQQVKKYIVVYKGNICENPADPDADDANAIAVWLSPPGFEVFAWGNDDDGQVSDIPAGSDFIAVAAGKYHCIALKSDGTICAWGWDGFGQVSDTPDSNDIYIAIAAGNRHSIALKSDGSIVVWGDDSLNQITNKPAGNDFTAIAAGDYHSLALKSDGTIVGWGGWNNYGECDAPAPDAGTVYTAIAAGKYHSLALQSNGIPKAWGSNNQGQTRFYSSISGIAQVAACDYYSMVLRDDQWITTWGGGDWVIENELPRYHHRPADSNDFVAVAAGWDHILALTSDGKVFAWDWPMGDYPFEIFSRTVPEGIVFTEDISAGYDFSLALKVP